MKNNFSDSLIANEGSRFETGALRLDVRLPWYRSLPLSVIEPAALTVDGRPLPLEGAELELEGRRYPLRELGARTDAWWFVQDSAYLHVPLRDAPRTGAHEVSLVLNLYPPYIPMLTWVTRGDTTIHLG
jgi:hypothetical protein